MWISTFQALFFMLAMGVLLNDHLAAKVCLNMIVKDETPVIQRCLESVKPLIDYWVIVDTGSTDGTQELIREVMQDIPGELHERPWINFGHNRNEALELARGKADYFLFIDADEKLALAKGYQLPTLDKEYYYIMTEYGGTKYLRVQLVQDTPEWKWAGVVHEVIYNPDAKTSGELKGVTNLVSTEGNRAKDPKRFHRDAELLELALKEEPNHTRNLFYLGQSYKDAGEHKKALDTYEKRVSLGGWDQEVFWSLLQIARLQEALEESTEVVAGSYFKAYAYRPSRAEPLYYLANFYRRRGDYSRGYEVAAKGVAQKVSDDLLFVEHWAYDYGLLLEFSICAYWIEKYTEALLASRLILAQEGLPQHYRECVERNLVWIDLKLKPQ